MDYKYCSVCYYYRPIGARFCSKCGSKFEKQGCNWKKEVDKVAKEIDLVLKDDFFKEEKEKWK